MHPGGTRAGSYGDFVAPSEFEIGWEYGDVVNIDTRTEQSVTVENRVTNLYVLLAAANGEIIHRKSYWVTRDSQIPDGYDNIITAYSRRPRLTARHPGNNTGILHGGQQQH